MVYIDASEAEDGPMVRGWNYRRTTNSERRSCAAYSRRASGQLHSFDLYVCLARWIGVTVFSAVMPGIESETR